METNILASVKQVLNVEPSLDVFDEDISSHINTAFAALYQLGVGAADGFELDDGTELWADFIDVSDDGNKNVLNLSKAYINLRAGMLFDPPTIGFLLDAKDKQLREYEWRISQMREEDIV